MAGMSAPRLLHITDTHLFASPRRALRGVVTDQSLQQVLQRARRHAWPPQAILLTGDLVHDGSSAGYERLRDHVAALGVPAYCIAGNHDDPQQMRAVLDAAPLQCAGCAEIDSWCIVLLETHVPGEDGGTLAPESLARLDATLAAHADRHVLVCLHHQPVAIGSAWLDALGLSNRDALFSIIARHPNVRALLWGHVHQVFDEQVAGLRLLATPSTCVQFKPNCTHFRYDILPPGCRWLTLHEDGRIGTEVLWVDA
jgi:3',5'-cyclic-AMP phosphodiesterase